MNLANRVGILLCSAACVSTLVACDRDQAIAPPEIRYGEDMCAECGMIVSDDRFAAALIRDGASGREALVFDDIGCLLVRSDTSEDAVVLAKFIRDSEGGGWLDMAEAFYVRGSGIETPMAFDIAAFSSPGAALARQEQSGGSFFDFTGLMRAFAEDSAALDPLGRSTPEDRDEFDGDDSGSDGK
jgi:copper chaperone NosL